MTTRVLKVTFATLIAVTLVLSLGISATAAGNGHGNKNANQVQISELSVNEIDWLVYLREEEKLARDVYLELFDRWELPIFENIAASEQKHTDSIENLLDKYGLPDPVDDEEIRGNFENDDLNTMYDALLIKGNASITDALEVGVIIELADIADLEEAMEGTDHKDIERVYTNLLRSSNNHLAAFNSHL